jgi:hypothetical protein
MRWLKFIVLTIAAFSAIWWGLPPIANWLLDSGVKLQQPEMITRAEPLRPYPDAVRVNLRVNDLLPDRETHDGNSTNPSGRNLTNAERAELENAVSRIILVKDGTDDRGMNACFEPHHFFRFYDAQDRQIGEIAVCFCCWNTRENPEVIKATSNQWSEIDIEKLEKLVQKMGLPTEVNCQTSG